MDALKILYVEDNESDAKLLSQALAKQSTVAHKIEYAVDGDEALQQLPVIKPDLLITNLDMPKVDGRTLLRELRSQAAFKRLPVVILTGSDYNRDVEYCAKLQVDVYLLKPFDLDELNRIVAIIVTIMNDIAADKRATEAQVSAQQ